MESNPPEEDIYGLSSGREAIHQSTGDRDRWNEIGGRANRIFGGGFGLDSLGTKVYKWLSSRTGFSLVVAAR